MTAATHTPTDIDLRRRDFSTMADRFPWRSDQPTGRKVPLSWELITMLLGIIMIAARNRQYELTMRVHLLFTA
jgi:hypothetical protein